MNAAIGMAPSTSDFFDATQPFAYDKRLYKEFPYAGFYLGLCEERLESELELWSYFRSYLTNDPLLIPTGDLPDPSSVTNTNSVAFIESCWRKTLNLINRTKGLSLSLPPQRLMLFKWCERACDLSVDEPILILYWQKFFQIYLDKDYMNSSSGRQSHRQSSSFSMTNQFGLELQSTATSLSPFKNNNNNNNSAGSTPQPIDSVTFKLFTSTSQMNTLLKQIKKVCFFSVKNFVRSKKLTIFCLQNDFEATGSGKSLLCVSNKADKSISRLVEICSAELGAHCHLSLHRIDEQVVLRLVAMDRRGAPTRPGPLLARLARALRAEFARSHLQQAIPDVDGVSRHAANSVPLESGGELCGKDGDK